MTPIDPSECPPCVPDYDHLSANTGGMNSETLPDHSYSLMKSPKLSKIGNTDELARNFLLTRFGKLQQNCPTAKPKVWITFPENFSSILLQRCLNFLL